MIRKLRIKFVVAAMLSLLAVLAVLMGSVNLINYRSVVSDADAVLDLLAENGGSFPEMQAFDRAERWGGRETPDSAPEDRPEEPPDDLPDRRAAGERAFGERRLERSDRLSSPELPFESRYFSVRFDGSGAVASVDTGMIAAVDEEEAEAYAAAVYGSGASKGFRGDYRFIRADGDGGALIVFLDCGRMLASFRTFLLASIAIAAIGFASVFVLISIFSARIVRPVAESYEKQRRFITDASHELKTPLAIIEADADVLEMDVGVNEWLADIRTQTARLNDLTQNLVSLSRMEEGESQFRMIDFPVSDVVSEAAQSYQAPAMVQDKDFSLRIQPMLTLCGDEKAVRQLVGILLDNALKYTPAGGRIALTLEKQGKGVRLSVTNTAESIDEASLRHLFDRFYRADASRNSKTGGYGIGLSIAQAIVTAHKGKIGATASGGELTISATLPGA